MFCFKSGLWMSFLIFVFLSLPSRWYVCWPSIPRWYGQWYWHINDWESPFLSQLLPSPPLTSIHLFCMSVSLLLLCKTVCVCSVAQSCPTLCNPMDYSPPSSSVRGIFQARMLEWVAIFSSQGSSKPKDWTGVFCVSRRSLYHWFAWEALLCK